MKVVHRMASLSIASILLVGCGQKDATPDVRPSATSPTPAPAPSGVPAPLPVPTTVEAKKPAGEFAHGRPDRDRPGRDRPLPDRVVIDGPALGSSAIRVPSTMKQGKEVVAQLVVSPTELGTLLRRTAPAGGDRDLRASQDRVRLEPRMRASLLAPGFEYAPKDSQEQAVQVDEPTTWTWTLVPSDAGPHTLVFTLEGIVAVDGHETVVRPPALTVPVTVDVDAMRFVEKYWQWATTAILIPLVVFVVRRRAERRAKPRTRE